MGQQNEGILSPYRVLDLTDEKGFLCGKILADFGADVIKIEKPGGATARNTGPFYHNIADPEKSLYWLPVFQWMYQKYYKKYMEVFFLTCF